MQQTKSFFLWPLVLALLLSLGWTVLVLRGGWSLGLFLAVLLTEIVFLAWQRLPPSEIQPEAAAPLVAAPAAAAPAVLRLVLAIIIIDLGFCFALYDNILLKVLNFLILLVLLATQFLLESRVLGRLWDSLAFWLEILISSLVRPWVCLADFGRSLAGLFRRRQGVGGTAGQPSASASASPPRLAGRILLGLLLAIPVLLVAGSLLASADVIFAGYFTRLREFLAELSLNEIGNDLLITLILLPFCFSFLQSGRRHWRLLSVPATQQIDSVPVKTWLRIDKTVLITFLSCINVLYLVFAFVQLAYLTGAFQALLPEGMTYAEYARSGFFELAFISAINLALILLAVKAADRQGPAGILLRIESLLLAAGSLVQWASALFRMNLYVGAFGLTLLRFLVTAFMLLLFVLFVLLLVKEFRPHFPLFKAFVAAALASLLVLNHVNCDAWIAAHNARRYTAGSQPIDTDYYRELSDDAVPVMLQLTGTAEAKVAAEIAGQLLHRYSDSLENYRAGRWQRLNLSQERARNLIAENLDRLKKLSP